MNLFARSCLCLCFSLTFAGASIAGPITFHFFFLENQQQKGTGVISFDDPGDGTHLLKDLANLSYNFTVDSSTWDNAYDFTNPNRFQNPSGDGIELSTVSGSREIEFIDTASGEGHIGDRLVLSQNNVSLNLSEGPSRQWGNNTPPNSARIWTSVSCVRAPRIL